jgi:hypothetical protein
MAIQETFDGGFIITGETHDSLYLRKTNQSGDTVWTSCCGIWPSRGFSVQQISDSGYVVTGAVDGTDIILVRYDTSGNVLWTKIYGGDGIDIGEAVAQTSDGGFIITGITDSFGAGSYDLYLIKTDVNGDTVWTKTYGGVGQEKGDYIQVTHDGNFIITGLTTSFGAGGSDVWLLKVTTNVGIANYEPVANERFHGATIVNGPLHLPEGKKCRIYDITGRVAEPDRIQSGIYFVEIDGILTQKVVKVK